MDRFVNALIILGLTVALGSAGYMSADAWVGRRQLAQRRPLPPSSQDSLTTLAPPPDPQDNLSDTPTPDADKAEVDARKTAADVGGLLGGALGLGTAAFIVVRRGRARPRADAWPPAGSGKV